MVVAIVGVVWMGGCTPPLSIPPSHIPAQVHAGIHIHAQVHAGTHIPLPRYMLGYTPPVNRQTLVKTLPSRNFVSGWKKTMY